MAQWLVWVLVRIWSTRTPAFLSSASSSSLQRPKEVVWGEHSLPHFLFSFFLGLFYFIVFYFDFVNFSFFRFSLIFKLIFVLACFAHFCNFSCINFYSLGENFEAWIEDQQAAASRRKFRNHSKIFAVLAKSGR